MALAINDDLPNELVQSSSRFTCIAHTTRRLDEMLYDGDDEFPDRVIRK